MTNKRPRQIVLTGASRGLGLQFTRQWLQAGHHVFALARSASRSPGLAELMDGHRDALHIQDVDTGSDDSVNRATDKISDTWNAVDLLLNNAGVYGVKGAGAPLTIEEAVASMVATIDRFTIEHSGGFYDRNGETMPW